MIARAFYGLLTLLSACRGPVNGAAVPAPHGLHELVERVRSLYCLFLYSNVPTEPHSKTQLRTALVRLPPTIHGKIFQLLPLAG